MRRRVTVVGIGVDGWAGLAGSSRTALASADVVIGSTRQLGLLPPEVTADRVGWPSPLLPSIPGLLDAHHDRAICVLGSGDPMFHGIGATLTRAIGAEHLHVLPHPSSISLAAARLGWPLADADVLNLVTAPVEELHTLVHPGRRILVLSAGTGTPAQVARLLVDRGFGLSTVTVLSRLGAPEHPPHAGGDEVAGPGQRHADGGEDVAVGTADEWLGRPAADPLNVVAIHCTGGPSTPTIPGLPDHLYDSDGQLTKREVRAVTLAALAPVPGELLWDVGSGSGSIAIEWMRTHRACRAIAVEPVAERATRITANAARLGVPALRLVEGRAPGALAGLPAPDAIFIGGGLTRDGVLEACLAALGDGARLVANAVTVESEAVLAAAHARLGGDLTRIAVQRAAPVGGFTGWRAMMPVTVWSWVRS